MVLSRAHGLPVVGFAGEMISVLNLTQQRVMLKDKNVRSSAMGQLIYDNNAEKFVFLVEATLALYYQVRNATTRTGIAVAICSYYHSVSGRSVIGSAARMFDTLADELSEHLPFFQSGFGWIDILDGLYSNTKKAVKSALGDKVAKVFNHVVAYSLYAKMGIDFDEGIFSTLEKKVVRPTIWNVASFIDAIVGLVLFLCKAGRQALITRDINCFFIDDQVLTSWIDQASELRKNAEFINSPTALGMAVPEYVHNLKSCIADGRRILPYFKKGREHTILFNSVLELESVLKRHECAMMSSSFRRAPVCVLLYGSAGVAKSFIAKGLFNHYCSVREIPAEKATMWTRTEGDDYYSGYKSHFAGVLYDDAAKYRKSVIQGVDPSIGDLISAINNISFVTPQADLPDKGKIPFLSEWVGVTSNVGDLAADLYFNSSAAFLRRFAARVTPIVKEEYRMHGEDRIDPSFMPEGVQYPDLWRFEVHVSKVEGLKGEFVYYATYETYAELLVFMTGVYEKHIAQQNRLMDTVGLIGPEKLCKCKLPASICACEGQGEALGADPEVMAQVCLETCHEMHWHRVSSLSAQKSQFLRKHDDKVIRAYIKQLYDDPTTAKWFDPAYCEANDEKEHTSALLLSLEISMEEFLAMDARDRLNTLSGGSFSMTEDGADDLAYISFTPKIGPPGFYLETQIKWLRNNITQYCQTLNDKEMALLDVYLYEQAPKHVVAGWALGDIIMGGYDYVKYYSNALEDPDREHVREFLMDTRKPVWYERLGVKFAVAYFENEYLHKVVNVIVSLPGVTPFLGWCVRKATGNDPRTVLGNAGRRYDISLGGNNKYVRMFLFVAGAATLMVAAYKFTNWLSEKRRKRPQMPASDDSYWDKDSMTYSEAVEIGYIQPRDVPAPQMDLNAVGKKPIVRESEKKNVWHTPERNITRLDVDPRRPNDAQQAENVLRTNTCYAEVRGNFKAGVGTGRTRVLIINSEMVVINNHALPVGAKVTIWLNKATETGVQPSFELMVSEEMVTRYPSRDVAIVRTWGMPHAFKDIRHLFPRASFQSVGHASYYLKEKNGELVQKPVVGVHTRHLFGLDGATSVACDAWASTPLTPTVYGECGMPLVVNSPLGSVVVGIHAGYHATTNTAWAVRINYEDLDLCAYPTLGRVLPAFPVAQVKIEQLRPTDKLYTDYHETGHLITHGAVRNFVARPKFTGMKTPYAEYVFSRGQEFSPPIEDNMAAPRNCGWRQPQAVLETYLHPTHSMNEMVVRACTLAYCEHIKENLTEQDWADIHPVPLSVAVNGFPGVPNVDAQKFTTSAGHGKRGPKLQFLSEPEQYEEWQAFRVYDSTITSEIDEMRENAFRGVRPHAIYDACFKDQLLSKAKVELGKARAVYMCPLAFLTNVRMSTLGICRVMIRRRDVFGCAIGLNTHSEEWDDIFKICEELEGDNWAAGDFKNFESVLNLLISNAVSKVFQYMADLSGNYDSDEMMALRVWLADISNATINFFGELITLLGGEASGQQMTTPFNCVANNLLHMYAYVVIYANPDDKFEQYLTIARTFFKYVRRNTLGDDVYLKVCPSKPEYNHTSIMHVFSSIGITYTMADKGAESRPYISHSEVTFLKRSFVNHSAFPGMKVAALDRKSIYKMICYTVPSKSASKEEQLASALCCAQAEAFFHDREFFDQISTLIHDLPKSDELLFRMKGFPLPTWDVMCRRFVDASPKLRARMMVPEDSLETTETKDSYCHASELELQMEWSVDPWGSTTMECSSEDRIYGRVRLSSKRVPKAGAFEITPTLENNDFSKNLRKTTKNPPTPDDGEMAPMVVEKAINKLAAKRRRLQRKKLWNEAIFVFQADINYDTVSVPGTAAVNTTNDVSQEVTVFKNEPLAEVTRFGSDADSLVECMKLPQQLTTYLHRPKLIFTYQWAENGADGVKGTFSPWSLYFGSSEMQDKLRGYSMMRCKLHLKFLINGSPFYYGSMMAAYTPLLGTRTDTAVGTSVATTLVATSQKPHVWLENQNSSGQQMELPFLYPYPYVSVSSFDAVNRLGSISLVQYAPLLSANGTGSSFVDIQVYAWAEDVKLTGPTNLPVMQSEFVPDKQVSKTASVVQSAAGALSKIPVIGAYARATEMAAGTLSGVASHFGFTNVPNVKDVAPVKQVPFQLASTEISEPVCKLSLQAKQETSIGSAQHGGSGDDELVIKSLCERTSFLVGSDWLTTMQPGDPIFTTAVTPQQFNFGSSQIAMTPACWVSTNFQYWRGPTKYTFKVIRSPYHRGRLQVSWDSAATDLNQGPAIGNPNTLTTIMDLDENSECSFIVPYMKPRLFIPNYSMSTITVTPWSTSLTPSGPWINSNGVLSVRVLNRLTAPEAASSARVLVFVSTVDDFEFAGPREYAAYSGDNVLQLNPSNVGVLQSDIQYDDGSEAAKLTPLGSGLEVYKQAFGERLSSMRELMHRSSLSTIWEAMSYNAQSDIGLYVFRLPFKRLPPPPGVVNNGWNVGTTGAGAGQRVFYSKFHPITMIASCFIGVKGSVNVTVNVDQPSSGPVVDTIAINRLGTTPSASVDRLPSLSVYGEPGLSIDNNTRIDTRTTRSGLEGMALTNTRTNTGMVAQIPYYSPCGFNIVDPLRDYSNQDSLTFGNSDWFEVSWRFNKASGTNAFSGSLASIYYATGPDFDLVFFINVPILTSVSITTV